MHGVILTVSQDSVAQLFLKYDYAETKDLAEHFLTLVVSILVVSLTFSEKIVDFRNAARGPRGLMVASWCLMLIAIVSCGLGLVANSIAAGQAVYGGDYRGHARLSYAFIIVAGAGFIGSLISLTLAAILSSHAAAKEARTR